MCDRPARKLRCPAAEQGSGALFDNAQAHKPGPTQTSHLLLPPASGPGFKLARTRSSLRIWLTLASPTTADDVTGGCPSQACLWRRSVAPVCPLISRAVHVIGLAGTWWLHARPSPAFTAWRDRQHAWPLALRSRRWSSFRCRVLSICAVCCITVPCRGHQPASSPPHRCSCCARASACSALQPAVPGGNADAGLRGGALARWHLRRCASTSYLNTRRLALRSTTGPSRGLLLPGHAQGCVDESHPWAHPGGAGRYAAIAAPACLQPHPACLPTKYEARLPLLNHPQARRRRCAATTCACLPRLIWRSRWSVWSRRVASATLRRRCCRRGEPTGGTQRGSGRRVAAAGDAVW